MKSVCHLVTENLRKILQSDGTKVYLIKGDLSLERDVNRILKFAKKNVDRLFGIIGLMAYSKITQKIIKNYSG